MVPQGKLADAPGPDGVVQRAAAHLCAQGTGIVLLPHVENDLLYVCLQAGIRYVQFPAHVRHRGEIHALETQLHGHCLHLKALWIVCGQMLQGAQQQHGVLAAGHAHGHGLPVVYHVILVHRLAHKAGKVV